MSNYSNPLNDAIDHFLNHSLSDVFGVTTSSNLPSTNIYEDGEKHYLDLAIPGVAKKDLSIALEKNKLVIKAEKKDEVEADGDEFIRREFDFRSFERSFHLPETADVEKVEAQYDAGILKVSIAKREEALERGPIDIKIS
jgi:HSP20 family protein